MLRARALARWLLTVAMVAIGVAHFVDPEPFVRIVPAWCTSEGGVSALLLVYVSGFFEIAGGLGLAHSRTRRPAALGLIALYIAVFPANVHMAVSGIQIDPANPIPGWLAWVRLPFQALFIGWVYWLSTPLKSDSDR